MGSGSAHRYCVALAMGWDCCRLASVIAPLIFLGGIVVDVSDEWPAGWPELLHDFVWVDDGSDVPCD